MSDTFAPRRLTFAAAALWLLCFPTSRVLAEWRTDLEQEIDLWKPGLPPPARLLNFPTGEEPIPRCAIGEYGNAVGDYIAQIKNIDLLSEILFHKRASADARRASIKRLAEIAGPARLAELFGKQATPELLKEEEELSLARELLGSRYISVQVAAVTYQDMPKANAVAALESLQQSLRSGESWSAAYRHCADAHPDTKDPDHIRTLISYRLDGVVSPAGFDLTSYAISTAIPPAHLGSLFQNPPGTYILPDSDAVYLYFVRDRFEGIGH